MPRMPEIESCDNASTNDVLLSSVDCACPIENLEAESLKYTYSSKRERIKSEMEVTDLRLKKYFYKLGADKAIGEINDPGADLEPITIIAGVDATSFKEDYIPGSDQFDSLLIAKKCFENEFFDSSTEAWFNELEGGPIADLYEIFGKKNGKISKGSRSYQKMIGEFHGKYSKEELFGDRGVYNFLLAVSRARSIYSPLDSMKEADFDPGQLGIIKGSIMLKSGTEIKNTEERFAQITLGKSRYNNEFLDMYHIGRNEKFVFRDLITRFNSPVPVDKLTLKGFEFFEPETIEVFATYKYFDYLFFNLSEIAPEFIRSDHPDAVSLRDKMMELSEKVVVYPVDIDSIPEDLQISVSMNIVEYGEMIFEEGTVNSLNIDEQKRLLELLVFANNQINQLYLGSMPAYKEDADKYQSMLDALNSNV